MALSDRDKELLSRCLGQKGQAWNEFVDRYVGLVVQVVEHTATSRAIDLTRQDLDDYVAEVFLSLVKDDFRILRRFRGDASLATYLTVVARRIAVREMLRQRNPRRRRAEISHADANADDFRKHFENADLVRHLLEQLNDREARLVQLYYLQGLKYDEIAEKLGMPENSVGPTLARARRKMQDKLARTDVSSSG